MSIPFCAKGAERARALADPILAEVYDIVGFLRPDRPMAVRD